MHSDIEDHEKPFLMSIMDVFTIKGRGAAIAGTVKSGTAVKGDHVEIGFPASGFPAIRTTITAFIGFIRDLDTFVAKPGDNLGIVFQEVNVDQIEVGMVIAAPESIDFSSS